MKKPLVFSIAFWAVALVATMATTWREESQNCPICKSQTKGIVPGSAFIAGSAMDFRPNGPDLTLASLLMCETCGFTAYPDEFTAPKGLDKDKVRQALEQLQSDHLFNLCDRAITVERNWQKRPAQLARLALSAKWQADDTGESELIERRLHAAIEAHQRLLKEPILDEPSRDSITYLLGELHRQNNSIELAEEWLVKATKSKDPSIRMMAEQQRFLLQNSKTKPSELAKKIESLPPAAQIAAIPILRELNDEKTLKWLQRICLQCPDDLRETAIDHLVSEKPLLQHIPIFL